MDLEQLKKTYYNIQGFKVHFEWCGDGFLRTDYFPDGLNKSSLVPFEEIAWAWAELIASHSFNGKIQFERWSEYEGKENHCLV